MNQHKHVWFSIDWWRSENRTSPARCSEQSWEPELWAFKIGKFMGELNGSVARITKLQLCRVKPQYQRGITELPPDWSPRNQKIKNSRKNKTHLQEIETDKKWRKSGHKKLKWKEKDLEFIETSKAILPNEEFPYKFQNSTHQLPIRILRQGLRSSSSSHSKTDQKRWNLNARLPGALQRLNISLFLENLLWRLWPRTRLDEIESEQPIPKNLPHEIIHLPRILGKRYLRSHQLSPNHTSHRLSIPT